MTTGTFEPARSTRRAAGRTGLLLPTAASFAEHVAARGPLPALDPDRLLAEITAAGITGRGGAAFPVGRKMAAVLAGAAPRVVIGNGAEGEPASAKDKTLLADNPHLVLDGLQVAACAVRATEAFLYVHDDPHLLAGLRHALAERTARGVDAVAVRLVAAPARFVAGEESAVASRVSGGPALPRSRTTRVFEAGAFGRPTLVQNVETLAHLALIARQGAAAFARVGTPQQPGTMLFTVSGSVHSPGVVEAPVGVALETVVDAAGGLSAHPQAILLGGYHGAWVRWPQARELLLRNDVLRPLGLSVGAGVVVVLPADACAPSEVARVLRYLSTESAGQCGPCVFGLPALAATFTTVVGGGGRRHRRRLPDLAAALDRRGGCSHPDGSLRFFRSATDVFADHLAEHAAGRCTATRRQPVLPVPGVRG